MARQIVQHDWEKFESHDGWGTTCRVTVIYECKACGAELSFIRNFSPDEKNLRLRRNELRIPLDCHKSAVKFVHRQ